jgi:hypothetical protein
MSLLLGTTLDGQPLSLDPAALTTHGFVLGMTGSGKTGLCVVLIEELLRAGVPVIAVDSKGDLGTTLLSFAPGEPGLAQWVPDTAGAGQRIERAWAAAGLDRAGFERLRGSYEGRLYTPGSSLGLPLDLLGSLAPPGDAAPDAVAEAADGVVRSLLGMLGLDADPLTSREYLLLVQLVTHAWGQGQTPTLVDLVRQVASPPFQAVGALPLEDFFPQRERQALMVRLNGLLASPKFAAWRTGEPLDPGTLFRAPDGRPRLSVYSVAHLSDEERLFAVAQLLERVKGWMRKQSGVQGVRAVVLLDEIFGYFPPAPANPPTKPPLLSLLKQARAFGVSVVLATQNPIDLDYRGLANIGTWLVGRLQAEQDKARIRDALASAAAATGATPAQLDALLSTLQPRRFLLQSVHRPAPAVFASRDAWTVLRGPFSAEEVRAVTAPMKSGAPAPAPATATAAPAALPVIDPELGPVYEVDRGTALPYLLLKFGVRYRAGTTLSEETVHELVFPLEGTLAASEVLEGAPLSVAGVPFQATVPEGVTLSAMPAWVASMKASALRTAVKDRLPSKLETVLLMDPQTKLISGPLETPEAFAARVLEKQGLSKESQKLVKQLEKKRADLAQAERQVTSRKAQTFLSVGAGVLGLFGGRGSTINSVGRAVSSHRQQDSAASKVEDLKLELQHLEEALAATKEVDPARFTEQRLVPRASDVQVLRLALAYLVP